MEVAHVWPCSVNRRSSVARDLLVMRSVIREYAENFRENGDSCARV